MLFYIHTSVGERHVEAPSLQAAIAVYTKWFRVIYDKGVEFRIDEINLVDTDDVILEERTEHIVRMRAAVKENP